MSIGTHMSIAGGLDKALERGVRLGCETIQLFTKNRNRWQAKALSKTESRRFRKIREQTGIWPILAHTSYLINLASPDRQIFEKSLAGFKEELVRAGSAGIPYLVTHPGSHRGSGEKQGLRRVIEALNLIMAEAEGAWPMILLETTAGQGSSLGYRFEHLAKIRDGSRYPERLGFCFDACHVFVAGYDIRIPSLFEKTLQRFVGLMGIDQLKAFHLNDSQKGLGSRVDRHQHIGEGVLGKMPFFLLLHDDRFSHLPMILETPKGIRGDRDLDEINLETLRRLRDGDDFG